MYRSKSESQQDSVLRMAFGGRTSDFEMADESCLEIVRGSGLPPERNAPNDPSSRPRHGEIEPLLEMHHRLSLPRSLVRYHREEYDVTVVPLEALADRFIDRLPEAILPTGALRWPSVGLKS